jgi:flagellar assembly protein FliH
VVRVNDSLHEVARARLDEIARARGFEGRLMVVAEPEIAVGDCKIEWADGGVVRNAAKTDLAIGNAIGRYLGARQTAAMPALGEITPGLNQETSNE